MLFLFNDMQISGGVVSSYSSFGFCPGVRVHQGITIVLSLFRSHWLAAVYCLVLCSGSCEPVHEDRTLFCLTKCRKIKRGCVFILTENGVALWFVYSVVVKTKCKCRFDTHVKSFRYKLKSVRYTVN